jgi:hypothetical protein
MLAATRSASRSYRASLAKGGAEHGSRHVRLIQPHGGKESAVDSMDLVVILDA